MPVAITSARRQKIIEQYLAGRSMLQISKAEQLSYSTIWELCNRFKALGFEGLKPRYDLCGSRGPKSEVFVVRAVRCLKTWHPGWGAGRIKTIIAQKYPQLSLPSERTIQRWFRQNGQNEPKSKPPQEAKRWAKKVHEV